MPSVAPPSIRHTPIMKLRITRSSMTIPDAQNAELKSLLENGLKIFQDHLRDAQNMVKELSVAHQ